MSHQVLIHLKKEGAKTLINCGVSVYCVGKWYFTSPIFRLERDLKRFSKEGVQKLNGTSDSRGVNIPGSFQHWNTFSKYNLCYIKHFVWVRYARPRLTDSLVHSQIPFLRQWSEHHISPSTLAAFLIKTCCTPVVFSFLFFFLLFF